MNPLSIIVPVYGVEKYLRQCLESIVAQTFKNFECILVDDGSKDESPKICDEYAAKDSRFRVIHRHNAGYGVAVNTGLDVAMGEYVGIVEPDDWIAPDMYEVLMGATELKSCEKNVDVVKAGFDSFFDNGKHGFGSGGFTDVPKFDQVFTIGEFPVFLRWHPSIWTCVYSRSFLSENGIRMEESPGATWQDNLFQVQTLTLAKSIRYTSKIVYHYRLFESNKLKDAMLPMRRTLQIRKWLIGIGYREYAPCAVLFCREMMYLRMSIENAKFKELSKLISIVVELLEMYKREFNHNYNFGGHGLRCLPKIPSLFVCYAKIKITLGRVLRAFHLRK